MNYTYINNTVTTQLRQNSLWEVRPAGLLTWGKGTPEMYILTLTAVKKMSIDVLTEESNLSCSDRKSQRCRWRSRRQPGT